MDSLDIRFSNLTRHINHVSENCEVLGRKLINNGEEALGLSLVAHGKIHDNSKFYGIEWEYLNDNEWPLPPHKSAEKFYEALRQHTKNNKHHPEAWVDGVFEMDRLHLAEMVCDWQARSSEQGSCLVDWVKMVGTKKFKFTERDDVYKTIMDFIGQLLDRRFT